MAVENRAVFWRKLLSQATDNFFDTIFPKECIGCKKENTVICPECVARTRADIKFVCPKCGKESFFGKTCAGCKDKTALSGFFYAGYYGNPLIRDAIYAWKYSFVGEIGESLGNIFLSYAEKYRAIFEGFGSPLVQAVPLNYERLLWRGFNQADVLAGKLAERFGYKKIEALARLKKTIPQSEVGDDERAKNIRGAFSVRKDIGESLRDKTIILVDDIFTSGSTMEECARTLKSAGAKEIWGFVLAKG